MSFIERNFNTKTPKTKYSCIWNVSEVLIYIKNMGDNEHLSLEQLNTQNTLPYSHNLPRTGGYTGKLKISCKTTQIGHSLGSVMEKEKTLSRTGKPMDIYLEDRNICPATTCLDYVNRNINFRKNQDNLFLSEETTQRNYQIYHCLMDQVHSVFSRNQYQHIYSLFNMCSLLINS